MPTETHDQLNIWLEIAILQRYVTVNEFRFPIGGSRDILIRPDQAKKDLKKLIEKACKMYDLQLPEENTQPQIKKDFTAWHREMLILFCCVNFPKMLCSFCPFSLGMDEMIAREGAAPCGLLGETKLFYFEPHGCIILTSGYWDERFLYQHIVINHNAGKASDFISIKTTFYA